MVLTVQTLSAGSETAPPAFHLAIWSTLGMLIVLVACLITYLFRHTIERTERSVQGLRHSKYRKHIQGPAVAVILAAVGGYGVNSFTEETGLLGYVGFLLALPIPLGMVFYAGVHEVRQGEFEGQWPPEVLWTADRVKVRFVLHRVRAEAQKLETRNKEQFDEALQKLHDEALPVIRKRRDRAIRQWLRDHRWYTVANGVWTLLTVSCAVVAVLPYLRDGDWALLRAPLLVAAAVLLIQTGLFLVQRRHSRYRYQMLADEVDTEVGELRRRLTKQHLGLIN